MGRFRPTLLIFIAMLRYCYTDMVSSTCPPKCVVDPLTLGAVAAPVIGAIGSLFGSSKSNKTNLQAVRETNEMNYKINKENNAFNAQQALLAQKYNTNERIASQGYESAPAQISRLKAAGLNPAMSGAVAAGSSSPASVSPVSASSSIPMQAGHVEPLNYGQPLQDLMQGALNMSVIEKNKADAKKAGSESHRTDTLLNEELIEKQLNNARQQFENSIAPERFAQLTDESKAQVAKLRSDIDLAAKSYLLETHRIMEDIRLKEKEMNISHVEFMRRLSFDKDVQKFVQDKFENFDKWIIGEQNLREQEKHDYWKDSQPTKDAIEYGTQYGDYMRRHVFDDEDTNEWNKLLHKFGIKDGVKVPDLMIPFGKFK